MTSGQVWGKTVEKKKQKQQVRGSESTQSQTSEVQSQAQAELCQKQIHSEGPDLHLKWSPISRGVDGPPGKASQGH